MIKPLNRLILLILFLITTANSYSQIPAWLWATGAGGDHIDMSLGVSIDADGNSYVTGMYDWPSIAIGDTTLINDGGYDIFVAKYDTTGNPVWAQAITGPDFDHGSCIVSDANANCYVAGNLNEDIFIIKYDSSGT